MVTKFRLQLFADNGRQSSAPFFTADVPPDYRRACDCAVHRGP